MAELYFASRITGPDESERVDQYIAVRATDIDEFNPVHSQQLIGTTVEYAPLEGIPLTIELVELCLDKAQAQKCVDSKNAPPTPTIEDLIRRLNTLDEENRSWKEKFTKMEGENKKLQTRLEETEKKTAETEGMLKEVLRQHNYSANEPFIVSILISIINKLLFSK